MEIARGKPRETQRNTKYLAICEQYGLMRGLPRGEGYRRLGCTEDADPNHYPYMLTKHKGTVKNDGDNTARCTQKACIQRHTSPPRRAAKAGNPSGKNGNQTEPRAAQQREKSGQRWECPKILWKRLDKLSDTPRRPQKRQQQLNSLYPATSSTHPSKSAIETASSRVNRPLAVRRNAER